MKVYLTHSKLLPQKYSAKILSILNKEEVTVLKRKLPKAYDSVGFEEAQDVLKENQKLIKNADIVIAELSVSSFAIGYFLSYAMELKKPIIAIYNLKEFLDVHRRIERAAITLKGVNTNTFIYKEYTYNTLETVLSLAINDAKNLLSSKFNLIIPPEINAFLEWSVKDTGIPKSEITRKALEKLMKENKRYQDYMKESGIK